MSSQQTPSITLKQRSRIKKVSHQINRDLFLLENSSKTTELSATTTFKRSLLFTWSSDSEVQAEELVKSSHLSLLLPEVTDKKRKSAEDAMPLTLKELPIAENVDHQT